MQDTSIAPDDGVATKTNNVPSTAATTTTTTTITPTAETSTNTDKDTSGEPAPQRPPRPLTEAQKNVMILKEAFPTVDNSVIKAVLRASGGQIEPAFNALLGEL